MEVGETVVAPISARGRWNDTGVDIVAGGTYQLSACGRWTDLFHTCDADGYDSTKWYMRTSARFRRAPREPWFALMGALSRHNDTVFSIGRYTVLSATVSGRLYCFANDIPAMYWNNVGHIELSVTRTA